ncbi:DUF4192 domain-containing protein [Nocardia sp. NPDC060259]|uniref:DUF4192 domain-containing protein n=1 Tax=Nocardia sp. NPDC060259 TaxID=3347088 RepID=UPI00364D65AF
MDADKEYSQSTGAEAARGTDAVPSRKVNSAGTLIAALPAMLGFVPARSVIIALLHTIDESADRREIQSVVRFDLDVVIEPASAQQMLSLLDSMCLREDAIATMAVVVDDRPQAAATAGRAVKHLRGLAVGLAHAWLVPVITAGAEYRGLLEADGSGTVEDPCASPIALAQVLDGVQIRGSRDELVELLTPDPILVAEVEPHIGPAIARYRDGLTAAAIDEHGNTHQRAATKSVLALIANHSETGCAPEDLATMMAVLRDRTIRDIMFGLVGTQLGPAAQMLWHQVARASSGPDRAEAAMLCGYDAYYRGDGVYAGICIEAALQAEPSHPMAVLLDAALSEGLRPGRIRRIAEAGRQVATDHGIDLPPAD